MRLSSILLLVAATLLANANALATGGDAEKRFLRSHKSHKKAVSATAAEEERGNLDGLFRKAPEELSQFERMAVQSSFRNHIFESWRTGMGTVEGAVSFMKMQNLTPDEIKHWTGLFVKYLRAHRSN
ncbi:hypothetical protein PF005_g30486 [Phytophthora fragariae]|uniref:RxLR effector protein n=2 Tax=Phytophthora TaxID=4783 RepID=A0A6A3V970_9STRA|nr:hypothetical protein PF003_g6267 [Phytophthora fragariae]KAE8961034.1 hypothetical protein PR002_g30029 [Phytophthora rubi]KAE8918966.1 hypothetical protein PF009_g30721 [Phytophthora fragariae]KAE8961141.1 hypothetical protein PR001_g30136 [Phytophthora rubi]KAE8961720.1 hypothetical protein PF011_g29645 [Phytophthora fragariae]